LKVTLNMKINKYIIDNEWKFSMNADNHIYKEIFEISECNHLLKQFLKYILFIFPDSLKYYKLLN
jgi:hypothetical protein